MELRPPTRLSGSGGRACREYVERLPLAPRARRALLAQLGDEPDPERALSALHRALGGGAPGTADEPALASLRRRLELARPAGGAEGPAASGAGGFAAVATTPALRRTPMAPVLNAPLSARVGRALRGPRARGGGARGKGAAAAPEARGGPAAEAAPAPAGARRALLGGLVLAQTAAASYFATGVLPHHGEGPLEAAMLVLFTVLFGWVSIGFWTAALGALVLFLRREGRSLGRAPGGVPELEIPPDVRTAVVMPICDEHVARVFAGLRATYASVAATGALDRFDFFVLSDSGDPDARVAETRAWHDLCAAVGGAGRVFYRWRRHRIKRKSGNVADFCRRFGSGYRYMVVLDADSVMTGGCLTALVRLMEANRGAGIIQTAPRAAGRETLHARVQQLASRLYGPLFAAGLDFWQVGESYYWGHNAIIRVAPFIRHCAIGRLPGRGPFSGEVLSHDFVEAALMRRAGWKVWIAHDLPGSYEEVPPNLADELKRDRRWCQGNLINARFLVAEGVHAAHRAVFMSGIMAYLSAPLWLSSLALSTAFVAIEAVAGPRYFVHPRQLFPIWPAWDVHWAIGLAIATGSVLVLPKLLAYALAVSRGARGYGGAGRLAASVLLETAYSALLAPLRMLFHSQFVVAAATGWSRGWRSPPREDAETGWAEALRRHGVHSALGLAWGASVFALDRSSLWWLLPVVGPLTFSVPLSVWSSRVSLGRRCRRAGLFLIPEELRPPLELRMVRRWARRPGPPAGFLAAVEDPVLNAVATAAGRGAPPLRRAARERLVARAIEGGLDALPARDRMAVLSDPVALSRLHLAVWAGGRDRTPGGPIRLRAGAAGCDRSGAAIQPPERSPT